MGGVISNSKSVVKPGCHPLKQETVQQGQLDAVPLPIAVLFWVWKGMIDGFKAVCTPCCTSHLILGLAVLDAKPGWGIELGCGLMFGLIDSCECPGGGMGRAG